MRKLTRMGLIKDKTHIDNQKFIPSEEFQGPILHGRKCTNFTWALFFILLNILFALNAFFGKIFT